MDRKTELEQNIMRYWYMRMRYGTGGEDFAAEMWASNRVGVLYGMWRIWHVTDANGEIDRKKLKAGHLVGQCKQPDNFSDKFLAPARRFLLDAQEGDRVVVIFDSAIHIGTIGKGFLDDDRPRGNGEYFKCRPICNSKSFKIADLPSVYRLLQNTQGTIGKFIAYESLVTILDRACSASAVHDFMRSMNPQQFLSMLGPNQWEVVCGEYLRAKIGFRFLLLQSGKTLHAVDLVGVDQFENRVVAQCKNDDRKWTSREIEEWLNKAAIHPNDSVYFFCRGGLIGKVDSRRCVVISGDDIASWLNSSGNYFESLKCR